MRCQGCTGLNRRGFWHRLHPARPGGPYCGVLVAVSGQNGGTAYGDAEARPEVDAQGVLHRGAHVLSEDARADLQQDRASVAREDEVGVGDAVADAGGTERASASTNTRCRVAQGGQWAGCGRDRHCASHRWSSCGDALVCGVATRGYGLNGVLGVVYAVLGRDPADRPAASSAGRASADINQATECRRDFE